MKPNSIIDLADQQNRFHETLTRFVNTGRVSKEAASNFGARKASSGAAKALVDAYRTLRRSVHRGDEVVEVTLAPYAGKNPYVRAMANRLMPVHAHLVAAVIHGSLGSSEEIPYSDFDGLVILRDHVLNDAHLLERVCRQVRSAQSIMIRCDPLQHHGWFVLTEFDLTFLCESHFPPVILEHARCMLPTEAVRLTIRRRDSSRENEAFFNSLANSVASEAPQSGSMKSLYELKAFLSRLMLLPAAYLQCRHGRGVWKKDSFGSACRDFSESAWECIRTASDIRLSWPVVRKPLFTRMGVGWGLISRPIRKRLSPGIPSPISDRLDVRFFSSVNKLAEEMRGRIADSRVRQPV